MRAGLDAGPRLVNKLEGFGDHRSAGIVAQIAEEERAHVAVGVYVTRSSLSALSSSSSSFSSLSSLSIRR